MKVVAAILLSAIRITAVINLQGLPIDTLPPKILLGALYYHRWKKSFTSASPLLVSSYELVRAFSQPVADPGVPGFHTMRKDAKL